MVREYRKREKLEERKGIEQQSEPTTETPSERTVDKTDSDFKVPKEKELKLLEKYKDLQNMKYDPDNDGFNFTIVEAFKINKRTMFFNFMRK